MTQAQEGSIQAVAESDLHFGPFRLERNIRLWHGEHLVALRPRALAVLRYIAERPGQLVTKEALLNHLWPGLYVTPTVLRVCVHAIRQALQDDPVAPRFLETVGRHGYRFIGAVRAPSSPCSPPPHAAGECAASLAPVTQHTPRSTPYFVGRQQELARLHAAFARAQQGARQMVLLLGEPGIGKTALVDRFLAEAQARGSVRIGYGQCLELHGPGEAYFPLLEALGQLCREPGGAHVIAILRRYAPLWVAQIAGLLEATDRAALQRHVPGSSRERMLRECAEAVERLAADAMLVLVCEDLQWSDAATVEALAYLAQRRGTARLHLIGTYRPAEVVVRDHPLRRVVQELYGHGQCEELALELLTEAEVEAYLGKRFGQSPAVTAISQTIHRATDGNALFTVHLVDYLCQQGLLVNTGGAVELQVERDALTRRVPDTVQQLITRQCEALSPAEQQLLRVASVAGRTLPPLRWLGSLDTPWRTWKRCMTPWRSENTSSQARGWRTGRTGRSPGSTRFVMPCISGCCTSRSGRHDACACTGSSGRGKRPATGTRPGTLRQSWRSILHKAGTRAGRCNIGSMQQSKVSAAVRIRRPWDIATAGWSSSRPCRKVRNAPPRNSACGWP